VPIARLAKPAKTESRSSFCKVFEQKTNKKHNRDEGLGGKRNSLPRSFGDVGGALWTETN